MYYLGKCINVYKCIIQVLQRRAKAEDMGDKTPEGPASPLFFDTLEILFQSLEDLKELLEKSNASPKGNVCGFDLPTEQSETVSANHLGCARCLTTMAAEKK